MKKKRNKQYSSISQHKKVGSEILPPFKAHGINMEPIEWFRDLLPEYLWMAGLANIFGLEKVHRPFSIFLDAVDKFVDDDVQVLGHLSDFGLIKPERRGSFLAENARLVYELFFLPFGQILTMYPNSPASWMVTDEQVLRSGGVDSEASLTQLRRLVNRLYSPKDDHTGHLRSLPLSRMMKHGKMFFPRDFSLAEVLPRYPDACAEDEKQQVQSFARSTVNITLQTTEHYKDRQWPKYFWRHNFELSICRPAVIPSRNSRPMTNDQAVEVARVLEQNQIALKTYIENLHNKIELDLYDPTRDEIHFGLISRMVRLYCLIAEDLNLWARDTSGIILRTLVDCAISFCYLVTKGSEIDYRKFKDYGEGQEKLLFLHLQDNYENLETLEGMNAQELAEELGGFDIELLGIELGNWTSKDTRRLAMEAGMEKYYRLVYTPTSAEVHGAWHSLKRTSLCRCIEPLHRFHRLATYFEPPAYIYTFITGQEIVKEVLTVATNKLGYPEVATLLLSYKVPDNE